VQYHRIKTEEERYLVGREYDDVKYAVDTGKFCTEQFDIVETKTDEAGNKETIVKGKR